jgi:hypothetical protein
VEVLPGEPADLVLFRLEQDGDRLASGITIEQTIAGGRVVFDGADRHG